MQHRLYRGHARMGAEGLHRAEYHSLAADRAILLRSTCAGAQSAAGGNEDGGAALRISHKTQLLGIRCGAHIMAPEGKPEKTKGLSRAFRKAAIAALHLQDHKNCLKCRHET